MAKAKKLSIAGVVIGVEFMPIVEHDGSTCTGLYDKEACTLYIATRNVTEALQRRTMVHEVAHITFHLVTNRYPEDEEQAAVALELGYFEFMTRKENRWALKWVMGEE